MTHFYYYFLAAAMGLSATAMNAESISSPDGNLVLNVDVTATGEPEYSLTFKDKEVIKPSKLGFVLKNAENLQSGFTIIGVDTLTVDETWQPVWGEESSIRNHYKEMLVHLDQKNTDRKMDVRFRLFNDGVGFHYEFPMQKNLSYFVISDEVTEFAMSGDHEAY